MENSVLLIYDDTGKVWGIYSGETAVPQGVQGIIADAPQNFRSVYVDTTTHEPVWEIAPDTENEVFDLQLALIELEARVSELEGGAE